MAHTHDTIRHDMCGVSAVHTPHSEATPILVEMHGIRNVIRAVQDTAANTD